MPELDLHRPVGRRRFEGVDRAERGVDLGVTALGALAAAATTPAVAPAGRGHEGQHGQEGQDQGGSLHSVILSLPRP